MAEECANGDIVEWAKPPLVRHGKDWIPAPSREAELTMFIGPTPYVACGRFRLSDGSSTEPMLIKQGQPLKVKEAR